MFNNCEAGTDLGVMTKCGWRQRVRHTAEYVKYQWRMLFAESFLNVCVLVSRVRLYVTP